MKWRVKFWRLINEQAGEWCRTGLMTKKMPKWLLKVSDNRMNRWRCTMTMTESEYEKIVKAMADKGVPHWVFELLADLRRNEIMNSKAIETKLKNAERKLEHLKARVEAVLDLDWDLVHLIFDCEARRVFYTCLQLLNDYYENNYKKETENVKN